MSGRLRLDRELVRRGLVASREEAQAAIADGRVTVGGAPAPKANRMVSPAEAIEVGPGGARFASRGGEKLDHALEVFGVDATGRRCIDLGASTGGFTDCLLQRGATEVFAVDVGYGQLHPKLRSDPRVHVHERTNMRDLPAELAEQLEDLAPHAPLVVADLSFISLRTVAVAIVELMGPSGTGVVLVKPQFEAGRQVVSRGKGVVRDPADHLAAILASGEAFEAAGAVVLGVTRSPLRGPAGNVEFLLLLGRDGPGPRWQDEAEREAAREADDG